VLERIGKKNEVMNSVKRRKLECVWDIMRNDKRSAWRGYNGPRTCFSKTTTEMFRAAVNKVNHSYSKRIGA
jgi:hypothetical protein